MRSSRAAEFSCTDGATPWAEKTTVSPDRHLLLVLDEDRATGLELAHDVQVVDDLLAHVDGRAVQLERPLDRVDRPFDAGAVAARRSEKHLAHHAVESIGGLVERRL